MPHFPIIIRIKPKKTVTFAILNPAHGVNCWLRLKLLFDTSLKEHPKASMFRLPNPRHLLDSSIIKIISIYICCILYYIGFLFGPVSANGIPLDILLLFTSIHYSDMLETAKTQWSTCYSLDSRDSDVHVMNVQPWTPLARLRVLCPRQHAMSFGSRRKWSVFRDGAMGPKTKQIDTNSKNSRYGEAV